MSQIAPDIAELADVAQPMRSVVWTRATLRAIRSPLTWAIGGLTLVVATLLGIVAGLRLAGTLGALAGIMLGIVVAGYAFFNAIIPWQARRLVASIKHEAGRSEHAAMKR
jgi:hypothetical protein